MSHGTDNHGTEVAQERYHAAHMMQAQQEVVKTRAAAVDAQRAEGARPPGGGLLPNANATGKALTDGHGSYRGLLANVGLEMGGLGAVSSCVEMLAGLKNSDPGKFGGMNTMETLGKGKGNKVISGGKEGGLNTRGMAAGAFMKESGNVSKASGMKSGSAALNTILQQKIACHLAHKNGFEASKLNQAKILGHQQGLVAKGMGIGTARAMTAGLRTFEHDGVSAPTGPTHMDEDTA